MPPDERMDRELESRSSAIELPLQRALEEPRDLLADLRAVYERSLPDMREPREAIPSGFARAEDVIVLLEPVRLDAPEPLEELGQSLWADVVLGRRCRDGEPALHPSEALDELLLRLAEKSFLSGSARLQEGGLAAALMRAAAAKGFGFHTELGEEVGTSALHALFNERCGRALVTARAKAHLPLENFVERGGAWTAEAIGRVTAGEVRVRWLGETVLESEITQLTRKPQS